MVGLGNIVGISVALMIGGPGSLFWTVLASIFGMLLK
jgi:AGCS family alanine or glycine:cation symporter